MMYFDEHNYESAIKDLKEASAIDDRNLKVSFGLKFRGVFHWWSVLGTNDVSESISQFRTI